MIIRISRNQWKEIGRVAGWIKEAKQNIVPFYHGTTTGSNFEKYYSFLNNGIKTDVSGGHGQQKGFYVWSKLISAQKHAKSLIKNDQSFVKGEDTLTKTQHSGYPMVVEIVTNFTPQNFNFDYEIEPWTYKLLRILLQHSKQINDLPANTVSLQHPDLNEESFFVPNTFKYIKGNQDYPGYINIMTITKSKKQKGITAHFEEGGNVAEAARIGQILNSFSKYVPNLKKDIESMEKSIFKRIPDMKAVALAYTGPPIKPSNIYFFINNQWVNVSESNIQQIIHQNQPNNLPKVAFITSFKGKLGI